jgi:hypothetical protein
VTGSATPEEAAAILAAIERFMDETTPVFAPAQAEPEPWTRAAMLESVTRETPFTGHPWINT